MSLPLTTSPDRTNVFESRDGWQKRLALILETMREMSVQTDPQAMVRAYARRMRQLLPCDRAISLSRRGLRRPYYRITRSTTWKEEINPWTERERLPVFEGGLLAELIYSNEPRIIDDLEVPPDDPAAEYLAGERSLMALPNFDGGEALNMVVLMDRRPGAFDPGHLPEWVWISNLFGRATHNLVLSEEVQQAYRLVDSELKVVADIQRSLLPAELPEIATMRLAAHYQTSRRAGGDYYDFLSLRDGRWGILIADVSGHGTPAAVIMAVTHAIVHTYPGDAGKPAELLAYVNRQLAARYSESTGSFVTAWYGVYNPETREVTYSCAGHNPPRLKRCAEGSILSIEGAQSLPLGIWPQAVYTDAAQPLVPGDQIVFYTDGIVEANNPAGQMFSLARLDAALARCRDDAGELIAAVLRALDDFTAGRPADDDRTLLVAKIV